MNATGLRLFLSELTLELTGCMLLYVSEVDGTVVEDGLLKVLTTLSPLAPESSLY